MTDHPQDGAPPIDPDATKPQPETHHPPRTIGPYRLLQLVGEGGMGEVWLAEQTHPVRRKVALKVIKAGMDTAPGRHPVRGRAPGARADGPPGDRHRATTAAARRRAGRTSRWST